MNSIDKMMQCTSFARALRAHITTAHVIGELIAEFAESAKNIESHTNIEGIKKKPVDASSMAVAPTTEEIIDIINLKKLRIKRTLEDLSRNPPSLREINDDEDFTAMRNLLSSAVEEGHFTVRRTNKAWAGIWTEMLMRTIHTGAQGLSHGRGMTSSVMTRFLEDKNQPEVGLAEVVERKRGKAQKKKNSSEGPIKRKIRKLADAKQKQNDYGSANLDPDMSQSELEVAKEEFLKNLETLTADKDATERNTILQRDSSKWLEIRKNLITASNFGPICKRQVSKDTAPLVKNILYKTNLSHVASIADGIENEQQALHKIQQQESVSIEPCGLDR
ncbi:unnamed protein product [Chilo suppressalis]|uniref:DUF4806 domain-containing protein n=1 Tax=Chilo suppressalis TaxID=168631 RepID=A0ABN8AV97_CHISP|nr:unnamed protein product [Chilo suppressalis]